jgi:hypothetical protein
MLYHKEDIYVVYQLPNSTQESKRADYISEIHQHIRETKEKFKDHNYTDLEFRISLKDSYDMTYKDFQLLFPYIESLKLDWGVEINALIAILYKYPNIIDYIASGNKYKRAKAKIDVPGKIICHWILKNYYHKEVHSFYKTYEKFMLPPELVHEVIYNFEHEQFDKVDIILISDTDDKYSLIILDK